MCSDPAAVAASAGTVVLVDMDSAGGGGGYLGAGGRASTSVMFGTNIRAAAVAAEVSPGPAAQATFTGRWW